ncbi:MAG: endonuclease/exonuclease/phosphatase family protein [Prevotella sp.]|nr:endonuclease/exonuclease/phosphatase family protein [Prevotella sp.]
MKLKSIKEQFLKTIASANVATVVLMAATGFSGWLSPMAFPLLTHANLTFPFFLVINIFFLLFWLLIQPRRILIPLAGLVICYHPVRQTCPINIPEAVPEGALKVMSFNVMMYAFTTLSTDEELSELPAYIARQDADIVCLQEADCNPTTQNIVDKYLNPVYSYSDTAWSRNHGDKLVIYSKYPILKKEHIFFDSTTNKSVAFHLDINGDTVIVVNNHLQSLRLSAEEKKGFESMVEGKMKGDSAKQNSQKLVDKLTEAARKRAPQAETVAKYVADNRDRSIILCGDFNDGPLSYTNHTIGKNLINCYTQTANGPGISYHRNGFLVRIDNIFCTDDWQPFACKVDDEIDISDHYPICCWLKKRPKTVKKD